MTPACLSRRATGASLGALTLIGLVLAPTAAFGQGRHDAPAARVWASHGEEVPVRRSEALLALLPRLEVDEELRRKPELHRAVAAMLVQERAALRDAGRAGTLSEEAAVTADVLMVVGLRLLPHASADTRAELLSALVAGYYAPGSRFAADLALYGSAIVGDALRLAGDGSALHRANGYVLMGRVLNNDAAGALEQDLSVGEALDLVTALRAGLGDEDASVRALVVDALAAAGDGASLRRLADVARRDVSPQVRERAREAVMALSR